MAQINPVQKPTTGLEQLGQAISIAGGVYGIIDKGKELDLQKQAYDQKNTILQNQYAKEQREAQATQNKDFAIVDEGTKGAIDRPTALGGLAPGFNLPQGKTLIPRSVQNEQNKTSQEKTTMLNNDYKAASLKTDEALLSYKGYKPLYDQAIKNPNGMNGFGLATAAFQTINPGYALRDFEYGKLTSGSVAGGDLFSNILSQMQGGKNTFDPKQISELHAMVTAKMSGTLDHQMDIDKDASTKALAAGLHPNDIVNPRYKKDNEKVQNELADVNSNFDKINIAKNNPAPANTEQASNVPTQPTYQPGTKLSLKNGTVVQINPDGKTYTQIGTHTLGQKNATVTGGR